MGIIMVPILKFTGSGSLTSINFEYSYCRQSFWVKNKDQILIGIICAVIGTVIGVVIGKVL